MSQQRANTHLNDNSSDVLLDGKFLTKADLKTRLIKMDIQIDNFDKNKQHYADLYNKLVTDYPRRMKIKSILDTDLVDRPDKNLNRKRERGESHDTPQFIADEERSGGKDNEQKRRSGNSGKSGVDFEGDVEEKNKNLRFEDIQNRNLSLGNFMEKIEKDCNDYRRVFQNLESAQMKNENIQMPNGNLLSFSKDFSFNKVVKRDEALRKTSNEDMPFRKRLDYELDEINVDQEVQENQDQKDKNENNNIENFDINVNTDLIINSNNYSSEKNLNSVGNIFTSASQFNKNKELCVSPLPLNFNNINNNYTNNTQIKAEDLAQEERTQQHDRSNVPSANKIQVEIIKSNFKGTMTSPNAQNYINNNNNNNAATTSRKSLPGSSKNIKEILNKIEIRSNPISPRLSTKNNNNNIIDSKKNLFNYNDSNRSSNNILIEDRSIVFSQPSNKPSQKRGISSSSSIIVKIRESGVSDFTQKELSGLTATGLNLPIFSTLSKAYNYKDYSLIAMYLILGAGIVLVSYFIICNTPEGIMKSLIELIENMDDKMKLLIVSMILAFISTLIFKKISDENFFKKIANEDYEKVLSLIQDNYQSEESPIGIFVNNFIRDFSKTHCITEGRYRKKVLPLLNKIRNSKKQIEEKEILIQEQSHKVWDYGLNY